MISKAGIGLLLCWLAWTPLHAETVTVAVASNFIQAAREIAALFEAQHGHQVQLSASSSGKLYAQISHGAPFDVFLSADVERPTLLETAGLTVAGSRRTYARGRLVLWSADARYQGKDCRQALQAGDFDRLAIANSRTAPYGVAAEQALISLGLDPTALTGRIAMGESIAQTLQFVASRSASMGLIADAQLRLPNIPEGSCHWRVPPQLHEPIEQQLVLLKRGAENTAARDLVAFLVGTQASEIIQAHGYGVD